METDAFFSRGRQLKLSLLRDLRRSRPEAVFGIVYAVAGFFVFRTVGSPRTFDVIAPFVTTSVLVGVTAAYLSYHEVRGLTSRFYANLARDRALAWDARLIHMILFTTFLETVIFVGTSFDLGGAGFGDHYRLRPEWVVMPLYAIAVALWGVQQPGSIATLLQLLVLGGIPAVLLSGEFPRISADRVPGELLLQFAVAGLFVFASIALLYRARRAWLNADRGDLL